MKFNEIGVFLCIVSIATIFAKDFSYSENNQGYASFDISMPIDSTGYTLQGRHLKGGALQFTDQGILISDGLARETGNFAIPTSTDSNNKPLIKTKVHYNAIKFMNPMGIQNLFIKIGRATRTQVVSGLDPSVLKDGAYTWEVPIFAFGREKNDVRALSENMQFMQVGTSVKDPSQHNGMYTQEFYLYTQGQGNHAIAGHPQTTDRSHDTLDKAYAQQFTCHAEGIWGSGGSDPYRTITGQCTGDSMTFPAGPNLDYEYGSFTLPTVHTPWTATPSDHCSVKGEQHAGCISATIASNFHFIAQKIRVPLNSSLSLYAEFGTAYRSIFPKNLRYQCQDNVYLKNLLPQTDCLKKSYLPGGSEYPYFAVGYEFTTEEGARYCTRYIYIPEQENGNRLAWIDASSTHVYAISVTGAKNLSREEMQQPLNAALEEIRKMPDIYNVLGEYFFAEILKKNNF